jgi:DNA-3-methyladenine glycosylase II
MAGLIANFGGPLPAESRERPSDVYGALLRAIAGQQLSIRAAEAIHGRLFARYGGRAPTPEEILADDPDALRVAAGLSHAKTAALLSLAEHVLAGELELAQLESEPDDQIVRQLVAVKGIGEWTAHMFLIFTMGRPDVLPLGDLGIRTAFKRAFGLETKPAMLEAAEPWRPYRTRASRYLWRSIATAPV